MQSCASQVSATLPFGATLWVTLKSHIAVAVAVVRKYLDPSRFRAGGGNGPSQAAAISMICNVALRRVRTNKCDFNAHLSINYLTHSWYDIVTIYNLLTHSIHFDVEDFRLQAFIWNMSLMTLALCCKLSHPSLENLQIYKYIKFPMKKMIVIKKLLSEIAN